VGVKIILTVQEIDQMPEGKKGDQDYGCQNRWGLQKKHGLALAGNIGPEALPVPFSIVNQIG
jgi:hypothetical protein